MQQLTRSAWPLLLLCCGSVLAADWQGRPVSELLQSLNSEGLQILFSSDVVTEDIRVESEPDLSNLPHSLGVLLSAHGLTIEKGPADAWLVRKLASLPPDDVAAVEPELPTLPEIVVTSSLHKLKYTQTGTQTYLGRELATRIPAAAEETARITSRLPGTASGGISARNHVRGGEANEVLFLLDGHRLYEPYHLKNFQTVATVVNSSAIDGIDFYTGAYPARYGDRMSGVMDIGLRQPSQETETELSLSFFNTSAVSLGTFGERSQGDWLFAARRGNLDLIADVINPELGSPDYQDYLLHAGWEMGPRARVSANLLFSNDKLQLTDEDRGEFANARYKNRVIWLKWLADWSEILRSETIVSYGQISDRRTGTLELPFIVNGTLDETRDFDSLGLKQDWTWLASDLWMLSFGVEGKRQDAHYRFESTKTLAPPFDEILDNVPVQTTNIRIVPGGAQYSAYVEARWQVRPSLVIDAGLRWDNQSYTTAQDDDQVSPRISVLANLTERTELRLGWGKFSQAQEINELQVSDGVDTFFPAQRAEHVVANLKHRFKGDINVQISYYQKKFNVVRPRFENAFNTLTLLPEIQFDRYRIDPTSAEAIGAELMVSKGDASESQLWWIGYAWSDARDNIAGRKVARRWDQTHTVKAGFSRRWGRWDVSVAGEVHTGWPRSELNSAVLNATRYSVFHTLDARLSRNIALKRGDLTVYIEVSNLYDRKNPCCTEYSAIDTPLGPTLVGKETNWLPLVPSLGVIWRF